MWFSNYFTVIDLWADICYMAAFLAANAQIFTIIVVITWMCLRTIIVGLFFTDKANALLPTSGYYRGQLVLKSRRSFTFFMCSIAGLLPLLYSIVNYSERTNTFWTRFVYFFSWYIKTNYIILKYHLKRSSYKEKNVSVSRIIIIIIIIITTMLAF